MTTVLKKIIPVLFTVFFLSTTLHAQEAELEPFTGPDTDTEVQIDPEVRFNIDNYILGPGDAIHLYVYDRGAAPSRDQFISNFHDKIFVINGFGEVDFFTLGKLKIADLSNAEITSLMNETLKPYVHEPMIIVRPLIRVTMRGEFSHPGMYRFSLDTTIWDMIRKTGGLVGGLDGVSALENMFILRKDEIIFKDFIDAVYSGTSIYELGVQSGDEIVVPRSNRPTFRSMLQYFQFGMNLIVLYLSLINQ